MSSRFIRGGACSDFYSFLELNSIPLSEKAMAPHSSTLAWKIPWTAEPGRLQSVGSLRVGHDWVTSLSLFTFTHWRRKWQPTPVFLPGESQGWGSLVSPPGVYGVAQSQTRLKRLSSSSIPLYVYTTILLLYSSVDGHFCCSSILAIMYNAAVNMGAQISLWNPAFDSFEYMARSGNVGSYGNSV